MKRIIIDNIDMMSQDEEDRLRESLKEQNVGYVIKTDKETIKSYTKEDLDIDLDWFDGLGVDSQTAEDYIKHLLECTWSDKE